MTMIELETLVRTGLADLAEEVRPVDLAARVAATRRHRRTRRRVLALGVAGAVAAGAVGAVVLRSDPVPEEQDVATGAETGTDPWLPAEIDLSNAEPVAADASLRLVFQTAAVDGTVRSYGLVTGSHEIVALPELPALPILIKPMVVLEPPAQLSVDGSRVLRTDQYFQDAPPRLVDTRTGAAVDVPWRAGYRAAGLSADGRSLAMVTLAALDPAADPPSSAPWRLTLVDLETGAERPVSWSAGPELVGLSTAQFAAPPFWSTAGNTVMLGVSVGGPSEGIVDVVASVDGGVASLLDKPPAGQAPWSPDGTRLVVANSSDNAYEIITADPTSADFGELVASGPILGRNLLGWSGADRLLWFDRDLGSLIETDLQGVAVSPPTPVWSGAAVVAVLLAPSRPSTR